MPNRLSRETSPYLRQHATNPVDWYPWGDEALARARAEGKPILLSIGYASCHWCHVMERESFEDEATARLMNEHFVNIKVDREERPDLDAIYMQAVQAMTGHGGWPMTVVLTPDGVPFFGGTYFPPDDRQGMPAFRRVLLAVAEAWRDRREDVERTTASVRELYAAAAEPLRPSGTLAPATLERAWRGLAQGYDARHGGFGDAPKFPQAMALDVLLRHWARTGQAHALEMARDSFLRMARGGIHDQVGGGFHRYTVDAAWLVPHFEKMLYDNALLARLGAHLWQATGDTEIRRVTEETVDWARREMTAPAGGFYSTLDADSEGAEGKFYLWSREELDALLGEDAELLATYWGVTPEGNFEGRNILHVAFAPPVAAARLGVTADHLAEVIARGRARLYDARARRVWPARDEKILAGWNGLMLRAVAEAARAFGREDYAIAARDAGEFLFRELVREESVGPRVMRVHMAGETRIAGFLEDHAAVALGALALHELTFERRWLDRARALGRSMLALFWDDATGGFFDTARDQPTPVTRPREVTDNALPSGTSLAVELLLRLAELDADADLRRRATAVLEALAEPMARYPSAFGHLLGAADLAVHGAVEVALAGAPADARFHALARAVGERYVPGLVLTGGTGEDAAGVALMEGREAVGGAPTAYVCRHYACDVPTSDPAALAAQLEAAARV